MRGELPRGHPPRRVSTPSPSAFPVARARFSSIGRVAWSPRTTSRYASPDPSARSLDYYSYVVSARDGSVLVRTNLAAHATPFTYRVWADSPAFTSHTSRRWATARRPLRRCAEPPYVIPAAVARNDVALVGWTDQHRGSVARRRRHRDAWATTSTPMPTWDGDDGLQPAPASPDYTANTSGANAFQYDWSDADGANTSVPRNKAAITQLFYMVNWLHDWYYDNGFDEAAGNAQMDNYGRGPPAGDQDPIFAETNDFSGVDNANMWTPADGSPPRMQMYVFDGPIRRCSPPRRTSAWARRTRASSSRCRRASGTSTSPDLRRCRSAQRLWRADQRGRRGREDRPHRPRHLYLRREGGQRHRRRRRLALLIWNATNGAFGGGFGAQPRTTTSATSSSTSPRDGPGRGGRRRPVTAHMSRATRISMAPGRGHVAHEWGRSSTVIAAGAQDSQQGAGWRGLVRLPRPAVHGPRGTGQPRADWTDGGRRRRQLRVVHLQQRQSGGSASGGRPTRRTGERTTPPSSSSARRSTNSTLSFPFLGTTADNPAEVHATGEIWAACSPTAYVACCRTIPSPMRRTR